MENCTLAWTCVPCSSFWPIHIFPLLKVRRSLKKAETHTHTHKPKIPRKRCRGNVEQLLLLLFGSTAPPHYYYFILLDPFLDVINSPRWNLNIENPKIEIAHTWRKKKKMWRRVASSLSPILSSPSSRSLSRNQVRRFPLRFSIPIARVFGLLWILTQFITYSRQLLGSLFENHLQRRLVNRYVHIRKKLDQSNLLVLLWI